MTDLQSQTTGAIAKALSAAQGEMVNPEKTLTNPHFKSLYADIAAGIEAVRGPLSKHGISFTQQKYVDGSFLMLRTVLTHADSGEWIASETPIIEFPAKPQDVASATTYYRRIELFSITGIAGDTPDDDGNQANQRATTAPKKLAPPPVPKLSEEESALALKALLDRLSTVATREDLKTLLVSTTTDRAGMWDDDKEAFKRAFRAAEDKISAANNGASNGV